MGDPKHATATDNGRYYVDPKTGELLMSVTNALNTLSKPALAPAAAKVTAEYIVDHLPAAIRASRRPETKEEFLRDAKAQYRTVWEQRRDLGSKVHNHAEAKILDRPIPDDPEVEPFIGQYQRFLDDHGIVIDRDVEFVECTVLHRRHRYGGTADLGLRLSGLPSHPSGLWLIDIKTSLTKPASTVYQDHVLQLAALRYAEVLLAPDDSEHPVPTYAGAAILNLRTNSYGLVPLPAGEAAHAAFVGILTAAYFSHDLDLKPCKPTGRPRAQAVTKGAA